MNRRALLGAALAAAVAPAVASRQARSPRRVATLTYLPDYPARLEAALRPLGWSADALRIEGLVVPPGLEAPAPVAGRVVATRPDVIVAQRSSYVKALAQATRAVPIVSAGTADPVGEGVAASLRRPGGNVTGLSYGMPQTALLQLSTFRYLDPRLRRVVFVSADVSREGHVPQPHVRAAESLGIAVEFVFADRPARYEAAIESVSAHDGVWLGDLPRDTDPKRLAAIAIERGVATMAQNAQLVDAGALFSVWLAHSRPVERTAAIVHRILRGEDPARIPFELPDLSLFRLNRTTARRLGLRLSSELLLRVTDFVG